MVFAEAIDDNQFVCSTSIDDISPDRISYAQVDMSCFTNLALDYVDEYVALDDNNDFYITDSAMLRKLLTHEQYTLVEEQINAVNADMTLYSATGTESNPYELTEGQRVDVTSSSTEYWFSCTTRGATEFYLTVSPAINFEHAIYKKGVFGKKLIDSSNDKSLYYRLLSDCQINNGANTYLVKITPQISSTNTYSAKITQHHDENIFYKETGAVWKPDKNSAIPDSNILYNKYWYVPKDRVGILVDYISNDKFIKYQQAILNGTMTATGVATTLFPGAIGTAASIITTCVGLFGLNLKEEMIQKIRTAAGYSNNKCKNGVLLIEYMYTPQALTFQDIKSWNGGTLYGPDGWTGAWSLN